MPVLEVWAVAPPSDFPNYAAGTWGPEETQRLLAHGHSWPLPGVVKIAPNAECTIDPIFIPWSLPL
jgi:glucose-6-phosphate 1-dehydrogenase